MNALIPLLLFCLSTTLTPGPNNFMIMNSGLKFGVQKSLPHYLGICLGFPLMVLIVALGLGDILQKYLWLKSILKIIGSAYMLYLAWHILFALADPKTSQAAKPLNFLQAALFQWANPKAWLMAIGAISVFTIASNYIYNAFIISGLFFLMCLPCIGVWLVFGASLRKYLKNEKHQRWFNIIMAACLVASIAMIIFD